LAAIRSHVTHGVIRRSELSSPMGIMAAAGS
jgi:hypothetical protein